MKNKNIILSFKLIIIILEISYYIIKTNNYISFSKIKVAICLIAKNENRYIKEFINHYKNLGVDKIFLYDNNDKNGEIFDYILKKEIKYNYIELINYRGKYKPQLEAYTDCYNKNKYKYNWIAFYDADELLFFKLYTF